LYGFPLTKQDTGKGKVVVLLAENFRIDDGKQGHLGTILPYISSVYKVQFMVMFNLCKGFFCKLRPSLIKLVHNYMRNQLQPALGLHSLLTPGRMMAF
jgi:hypothetical protein